MIQRPCARPGCPELVKSGHCDKHTPKRRQDRRKRKLYDSARWRRGIRPAQLRRHPLCQVNHCCTDPTPAQAVHHIDGNTDNNWPGNLQSVCTACHTWLENQDGGALT